jgi:ParB-like chromosome segregation protein Spo0J
MARGGARPGAGRPARKSANTSPVSARARARAREAAGNQKPWPADKVERWSIDRLIPYAKNARTHTDAQVAAIAASIKEWGWTTPALVGEDGGLIAGHARVLAARQLGIAEIPVMVAAGWSEAQKRAYVLADNQLAITGSGWDPELLRLELGELKLGGFDLSLTGFGDLELKDIMADRTQGLTDPDDAPAAPEHPVSQTGDLWCLGRHRLLCGDSTVATDVERVLGDVEPHLMVTDPPYGVNYDPAWRNQAGADCRPARRRASAPRSSPQRPSRGSRRCRAAGQRGPSRGPQSGRRPRPPAPASSIPTP